MASKRRTLDTLAPGPLPGQLALFPSSDGQRGTVERSKTARRDFPRLIGDPLLGQRRSKGRR